VIGIGLLLAVAAAGPACARQSGQITGGDVVGKWTLRITPAERRGFGVTIQSRDGGRPDLPLTVAARPGGGLNCGVGSEPADCVIRDGKFVITSARSEGRMTFTLTNHAPGGYAGTARMSARMLPFAADIGTVNMIRR
jgi:hypothetical protein